MIIKGVLVEEYSFNFKVLFGNLYEKKKKVKKKERKYIRNTVLVAFFGHNQQQPIAYNVLFNKALQL